MTLALTLVLTLLVVAGPAGGDAGEPLITGVNPAYGPQSGGTPVTITGEGLSDVISVSFGSSPPETVVPLSDTEIRVDSPAGAPGPASITLSTALGPVAQPAAGVFTYDGTPAVTSVSPAAGPLAGGNAVTVIGTGFDEATSVSFGPGVSVAVLPEINILSDTEIVVNAPNAGIAGTVDVTVTGFGTSVTSPADEYTFAPTPAVTSVSPNVGPLAGGTSVQVGGSGFTGTTKVMFNSTPAAGYTVNSDVSITATAPAGTGGPVDVTVTTAGGGSSEATSADLFTYVPAPQVTGLSATAGQLGGGGTVTIIGSNLAGATAVDFGSTPSPSITSNTSGAIIAVTPPAQAPSTVDVTVTTLGGSSSISAADRYTYLASASKTSPGPLVTRISPAAGPVTGGTTVTIAGTGLGQATAVHFGATPAAAFVIRSATSIVVRSPVHRAGAVAVTVGAGAEQSVGAQEATFTYAPAPRLSDVRVSRLGTARARLVANVVDGDIPLTTCLVHYGRTNRDRLSAACATPTIARGGRVAVTVRLGRLAPNTSYRYRFAVSTAAGSVVSGVKRFTTHQLPLLKAPLIGLIVQRSPATGRAVGRLLGIDGIRDGVAGESIMVRCVAGCVDRRLLTLDHLQPPLGRLRAMLVHPLTLSSATRIAVRVSKRGYLGRFATYAFAPSASSVTVELVRTGCLSSRGATIACPR